MTGETLRIAHAVEGEIVIDRGATETSLKCRWPFDRSTDEWIRIQLRFASAEYVQAVRALLDTGAGKVSGIDGGVLVLLARGAQTTLKMTAPGPTGEHFIYDADLPPRAFVAYDTE